MNSSASSSCSKPIIGVMGGASCSENERQLAFTTGELIASQGAVLLCGGGSGVMEAAARGCHEKGGLVIGILPGRNSKESPPNPYVEIPIFTGLNDGRNLINILTAEVIIAIGGGWGTLSEIALAKKNGKPVIFLATWELSHPAFQFPELNHVSTAEEAVQLALSLI